MQDPLEPLLVNKSQAARLLGVGPTGLNQLIHTGQLTVVFLGPRTPRISVDAIKALIAKHLKAAKA